MEKDVQNNNFYYTLTPNSAVSAIDSILEHAVLHRASDIHCDPTSNNISIKLRIDGHFEQVGVLPKNLHEEIISRLKILSGVRTDIHAIPQDGRWQENINDENFNIRISFMPTYHGENAVMRLLPAKVPDDISFAKLGFTPEHVRSFDKALQKTSGLILVTGPTGSGKTTTLHACISLKSREPLSIITLEDPVEYEIPSVRQVHIRHNHGVSFASGLRSALRQDPDIIMLGEIRDAETAKVAIHTALTGHLVFSSLHTNSALEAVHRLLDMGIDHYLIASTLKLITAQRLVRTICLLCFDKGCEGCRYTGFSGRSVIAEICEIDSSMKSLIYNKESVSSYISYAKTQGYKTIDEHGLEKVEWGITTSDEVKRVLYE